MVGVGQRTASFNASSRRRGLDPAVSAPAGPPGCATACAALASRGPRAPPIVPKAPSFNRFRRAMGVLIVASLRRAAGQGAPAAPKIGRFQGYDVYAS